MTSGIMLLLLFIVGALAFTATTQISARVLTRRRAPDPADSPARYGAAFEEVHFESRDGTPLVGWWIPAEGQALGSVVMCHGISGSMDADTPQMLPLHCAGFNVLMFDFRAHGRSGGQQVTMGMYETDDLLGAIDYLSAQHGVERVGVLGFSMGGATALVAAATTDRIAAVVADGSFGRLKNTLAHWAVQRGVPYALAWELAAWSLAAITVHTRGRIDQVDPVLWVRHVGCPTLFIHGADDRIVTVREVEEMAGRAAGPVEVWIVPGAGHRGAHKAAPDEYTRRVVGWFKRHLAGAP